MVLNPLAVKKFEGRKRRDSRKWKRASKAALDEQAEKMELERLWHFEPYDYQYVCLLLALKWRSLMLELEQGLGKTKITLDWFAQLRSWGLEGKLCVFVPGSALLYGWMDEARTHQPGLRFQVLDADGQDARWAQVESDDYDVLVVTYQGHAALCTQTVVKKDRKGKPLKSGKKEWKPVASKVKRFMRHFDAVAWDECSFLGDPKSLWFRLARRWIAHTDYRLGLTGTPFDEKPEQGWSQSFLVDKGHALGESQGLFRQSFCVAKENPFTGWDEWHFEKKNAARMGRYMRHSSIVYTSKETQDLPELIGGLLSDPQRYWNREVALPPATWEKYQDILQEMRDARGHRRLTESKYLQLRQLFCGYLRFKDDEGGEHELVFKDNPKLDALEQEIAKIPKDDSIIIFAHHQRPVELIAERLRKAKLKPLTYFGQSPPKKREKTLADFKAKRARILIGTQAIAFGLNLQAANWLLIFEQPESGKVRRQLEKRPWRDGQPKRCRVMDFLHRGTLETRIQEKLAGGRELLDEILKGDFEV